MTDQDDDKLRRAYRGLATEEPPASLDAAILARARERVVPRRKPSWMVPVSIAAVLVLGIGVSLRMQMEEPGVETSVPTPATAPERAAPATVAPQPPPPSGASSETSRDSAATIALPKPFPQKKKVDAPGARERADEMRLQRNVAPQQAPAEPQAREQKPAAADAAAAPPPAASTAAPAVPAAASPAAPAGALRAAPQAMPQSVPLRAKREAESDAASPQELRKSLAAPQADPAIELERIAQLRVEGRHVEADQALEAFHKRHPDYRIPDAVWERVRPR